MSVEPPSTVALPGEVVVWTGSPQTGVRIRRQDALGLARYIMFCGFAIFWETLTTNQGSPWFARFLAVPILLVGIYGTIGCLFVSAAFRAQTSYTVTDRAAYVERVGWFPAVRRYSGSALDSIQCESNKNGTGTIRFASGAPRVRAFSAGWGPSNEIRFNGFEDIADVERVYRLITAARAT